MSDIGPPRPLPGPPTGPTARPRVDVVAMRAALAAVHHAERVAREAFAELEQAQAEVYRVFEWQR